MVAMVQAIPNTSAKPVVLGGLLRPNFIRRNSKRQLYGLRKNVVLRAAWHVPSALATKPLWIGLKKSRKSPRHRKNATSMAERGCFGVGWVVVICVLQRFQALGLDRIVPSNPPGYLLFCRRSRHQKLPGVLGLGAGGLQAVFHFFWFLGGIHCGGW